jgi:hypothetical protein
VGKREAILDGEFNIPERAFATDADFFLTTPFNNDFWSFLPTNEVALGLGFEEADTDVLIAAGELEDGPGDFRIGGAEVAEGKATGESGLGSKACVARDRGPAAICSRAATALKTIHRRVMRAVWLGEVKDPN